MGRGANWVVVLEDVFELNGRAVVMGAGKFLILFAAGSAGLLAPLCYRQ